MHRNNNKNNDAYNIGGDICYLVPPTKILRGTCPPGFGAYGYVTHIDIYWRCGWV